MHRTNRFFKEVAEAVRSDAGCSLREGSCTSMCLLERAYKFDIYYYCYYYYVISTLHYIVPKLLL